MSDYLYHHFHVLFELLRAYVRRLSFLEKDRFAHLLGEEARAILEQGDEREREREREEKACLRVYTFVRTSRMFSSSLSTVILCAAAAISNSTEPGAGCVRPSRGRRSAPFPAMISLFVRCTSEIQMHEAGEAGVHRETVFGG